MIRALTRAGHDALIGLARRLVGATRLVRLDEPLLDRADALDSRELRSLDAHLAAALALGRCGHCDRDLGLLLHHCQVVVLNGDFYCLREAKEVVLSPLRVGNSDVAKRGFFVTLDTVPAASLSVDPQFLIEALRVIGGARLEVLVGEIRQPYCCVAPRLIATSICKLRACHSGLSALPR